jgi:XTP/dITP diphosphohydrolase
MSGKITIVLGTKNPHKVREILSIWRCFRVPELRVKFIPLHKYPGAPVVKETGRSYLANAVKKAAAWAKYTGLPALAEDSGLEVQALDGQPGIYSARYASMGSAKNADYKDNNQKLLDKLKGRSASHRTACYRCVAVLASPGGAILARSEGVCRGWIALKPAGRNGFGYDPVFIPKVPATGRKHPADLTLGQLPAGFKRRVSHRSAALIKIFRKIARINNPRLMAKSASGPGHIFYH